MKRIVFMIGALVVLVGLAACGGETSGPLSEEKLIVGATAGPYEQITEKVIEVAAQDDLEVELRVFTEYVMPNVALEEGEIDVNFFQHVPFLEDAMQERNFDLAPIATTVVAPMGIYSDYLDHVNEIEEGAKVALPNDPVNTGRALVIFEEAGWIKLKEGIGFEATLRDIEENPLNIEFVELDAAGIARVLDEFTAAAINPNFAIEEGYIPSEDALLIESTDPAESPLAIVLVVRSENVDDPVLEKLIKAYQSDEVKQFIEEEFQGSIVPAW